ncbi:MAG: TlyA family rRNA (cytidine-2'-O)-methyltransferase [Candidatus Aminicenantes bacterium]|nr:TlyA family rRNA (cytidine-2'-O)-methyltransferase [Candidatus Aminicenantes bacterium]
MKERADRLMVAQGLAESRQKAQALIMAGLVYSKDQKIDKPGQLLKEDQSLDLKETLPYVSRGGLKLAAALEGFRLSVTDKVAVDLGASTGGFTDCLLQRGACKVYAVDVDTRQLDWGLRQDPRVVLIQKNARYLQKEDIPEKIQFITLDLSFISVLKVLPAVSSLLGSGDLVSLIKPQFEVGKGQVGKKGVIRDLRQHEEVLQQVIQGAQALGFIAGGILRSPIKGQKGNREFFILWSLQAEAMDGERLSHLIKETVWNEND